MAANPLMDGKQKRTGLCNVGDLQELAANLNTEWWVQSMRREYFVAQERNPKFKFGSIEHKEREFVHTLSWRNI